MKQNRLLLLLTLFVTGLASCKKDKDDAAAPKVTTGVYILSEGGFGLNNSMLSYYNTSTGVVSTDFFAKANNGTGLGDTGNDMLLYGGKMYIVVHASSVLTIADKITGQKIKNIDFLTPGGGKSQPRYVVAYKNKVLVSAYDGTVAVIDTATQTIEKKITVGANPEQMVVLGDKLYVANSGGLATVKDSTISVISLSSMTELQKIKTGTSPSFMTADESGNLYVICSGDYLTGLKPKLAKISTNTNTMVKIADTLTGRIQYYNGALYATGGYYGSKFVRKLSTTDFKQESANFVTDGTNITMAYGINVDPENGDVYVTDAKDYSTSGEVFCFDKTGKKKFSFSTTPAVNPSTVVFIK
jgi:YVTN family beta-propeller protein